MAIKVAGEQYFDLIGQLGEINRQLRQQNGYKFDPADLRDFLQQAIEGNFGNKITAIIDNNISIEEAITNGRFDEVRVMHDVCSLENRLRDKMEGEKTTTFTIKRMDREFFSSLEFNEYLKKEGLRSATIKELLIVAHAYPEEQIKRSNLLAVDGSGIAAKIGGSYFNRTLHINYMNGYNFRKRHLLTVSLQD